MPSSLRLLALAAALVACGREARGPLAPVIHLTAERYQTPGDPSAAAVPTAVVGEERRPVLSSVPRDFLGVVSPLEGTARATMKATIPEALRGTPIRIEVHGSPGAFVVKPGLIASPGAEEALRVVARLPSDDRAVRTALTARPAPEREYTTRPLVVPSGALLRFAIGVEEVEYPRRLPPVDFRLSVLDGGREEEVFHARLDPARDAAARRWSEREVDLAAWVGRSVRLRFVAGPERASRRAPLVFPVWADPTILIPAAPGPRRPNVLLVSLDTLGAAHLGCYGYARPTSPTIDRLAAEGTLFEKAFSSFPGTGGSHMTLMTGLYVCQHGVEHMGLKEEDRLRPDAHTLAELLRAAGYATAAFTEDAWVTAASGFARGVEVFVENKSPVLTQPVGQAERTFEATLDWIARQRERPWFAFVHTYQVHHPYVPPPGYLDKVLVGEQDHRANLGAALYDAEIRYTDDVFARLLEGLTRLGVLDETLIVLTGDHGDQFGERGFYGHGDSLYDKLLHVPLIMRAPGLVPAGKRLDKRVGLVDVTPTVLGLLGLQKPRWVEGRNLVPMLHGQTMAPIPVFAELRSHHLVAGRTESVKWIVDERSGRGEAYNWLTDPGEKDDLGWVLPQAAGQALAAEYRALCAAAPPVPPRPASERAQASQERLDPAVVEKLRALGYVE